MLTMDFNANTGEYTLRNDGPKAIESIPILWLETPVTVMVREPGRKQRRPNLEVMQIRSADLR